MVIFLYNTLSRAKEEFKPIDSGVVKMYHCGPTVYDYAHIGNLRSFVFADILRRTIEYIGLEVRQVMNITDIDDKMIKRSKEEGVTLGDLADKYTGYFLNDLDALNIKHPHVISKATEHINDMVALIEKLLTKGMAYKAEDGSVYFSVSTFKHYGALARLENIELKKGEHTVSDEYEKENVQDFALWKAWTSDDGDVYWETSLGKGRPGWHIECSAMSMKYLGEEFDIHTGGHDLIFPHHTNEIAQSEGITGRPFVHYWLHNEFITVNSKKMSKSLGNIIILNDIIKKGFSPLAYRYWLLTAHYRSLANFTWEALEGAQKALQNLYEQYKSLGEEIGEVHEEYRERFIRVINDDLNTPQALALLWELIKDKTLDSDCKKATMLDFDRVLGLGLNKQHTQPVPLDVFELVAKREEARKKEDWQKADELRKKIEKQGYLVNDTSQGPKVKKEKLL